MANVVESIAIYRGIARTNTMHRIWDIHHAYIYEWLWRITYVGRNQTSSFYVIVLIIAYSY